MPNALSRLAIPAAFAAIYVIWGSTYLAVVVALRSFPPFMLMGTRSIIGGVILFFAAQAAGASAGTRSSWALAAVCGVLFFLGCHGVMAYAQQSLDSGLASVLLATIPFWVVLLNHLVPGGERARALTLLLLLPGLAGVGLIAWPEMSRGSGSQLNGILLVLGSAISWAVATILAERRKSETSPMALAGMQLMVGGAALLIASVLLGEPARFQPQSVSFASAAAWLYLTGAGTIIAFAAYIWLLKRVPPSIVTTYSFVNPIIAVALGWLLLGEQPAALTLLGAALVLASVAALLLLRARSVREETSPRTPASRVRPARARAANAEP